MNEPITIAFLAFLAGVVITTVVWTTLFWKDVDGRIDRKIADHEAREHKKPRD